MLIILSLFSHLQHVYIFISFSLHTTCFKILQQRIKPLSRPIKVTFSRDHPHKEHASYHGTNKAKTTQVKNNEEQVNQVEEEEVQPAEGSKNVTGETNITATSSLSKRRNSDNHLTGSIDMDATRLCYENFVNRWE